MDPQGLTFTFDAASQNLVATYTPPADAKGTAIDQARLEARIAELGYGQLRPIGAALGVLADSLAAAKPVVALAVAEAVDARAEVSVSPDKMAAFLTVVPPQGGAPISAEAIARALELAGVVAGIQDEHIASVVSSGQADHIEVATGRPPIHGADGHIDAVVPETRDRVPQVNEKGLLDYRNLGQIFTVQAGEPVMQRIPAGPGIPGETVSGQTIPAQAGKEALFSPKLTGVAPDPGKPDILAAAITGQPVRTRDGIIVEPTYQTDDVSLANGNIDFDGAVTVKGDVHAGMQIKASGDIEIGGMVEAAILIAGGDIIIKGGFIGSRGRQDPQGNEIPSYAQCGGSFTAAYVQQARVEAMDSIFIDDVAMQSELLAVNQIVVGNKQKGHIIGGKVQATLMVKARVIGAPSHIVTRVDIGQDPRIKARQNHLIQERRQAEEQLTQVYKLLELAEKMPERVPVETRKRALSTRESLEQGISLRRQEEELLGEQLRLSRNAKMIAEQGIYEGVQVHCGNHAYEVPTDLEHGLLVRVGENGLDTEPLARSSR